MTEAEGWAEKQCQACLKLITGRVKMHVHHVFSHPDSGGTHDYLVVLCAGCHQITTLLAFRKVGIDTYERLVAFALMQKQRGLPLLEVDIEVAPK